MTWIKCTLPFVGWLIGKHEFGPYRYPLNRMGGSRIKECSLCALIRWEDVEQEKRAVR